MFTIYDMYYYYFSTEFLLLTYWESNVLMFHVEGHILGKLQEQSFFVDNGHATATAIITQRISTDLILIM